MWLYLHRGDCHPVVHESHYMTDLPLDYYPEGSSSQKTFSTAFPDFQNIYNRSFPASSRSIEEVTRNDNQEAIKVMMKQG